MTIRRRVYKRIRTVEEISIMREHKVRAYEKRDGERFRIEVFNELDEAIYVGEIFGRIEIEEMPNGEVQINGANITQIRIGEER